MIKSFITIAVVMILMLFFRQPAVKGKCGEIAVALFLKFGLDSRLYRVLNDVMIPDQDGGTTQIDHIVLSPFGLFVIETKNMKGWIFGNSNESQWTQSLFKKKYRFQNPFRQNHKHIMCLSELTGLSPQFFQHIIVFVGDCSIKTRENLPDSLVENGPSLIRFMKTFSDIHFSEDDLDQIQHAILQGRIQNTLRNKRTHVAYINEIKDAKTAPSSPVCPRCGSPMVKRECQKGANAGQTFWGCSRYPKCKGIYQDNETI